MLQDEEEEYAIRVLPLERHGVLSPIGRFHGHIC